MLRKKMGDSETKITVITVVYNDVLNIEKTIKSVISQKSVPLEYIIIDGGSIDGTVDIIKKYQDKISYWISEADDGIYDAMNKGLYRATGNWVNFMNSGDMFYSDDILEKVFLNKKYNNNVKVIYGDVVLSYGSMHINKRFNKIGGIEVPLSICHQASFTDTAILQEKGFDVRFKIAADFNAFYSIYKLKYSFEYIPNFIAVFEAINGISANKTLTLFKELNIIESISPINVIWWLRLLKIFLKTLMKKIMPANVYQKIMCRRILDKF